VGGRELSWTRGSMNSFRGQLEFHHFLNLLLAGGLEIWPTDAHGHTPSYDSRLRSGVGPGRRACCLLCWVGDGTRDVRRGEPWSPRSPSHGMVGSILGRVFLSGYFHWTDRSLSIALFQLQHCLWSAQFWAKVADTTDLSVAAARA